MARGFVLIEMLISMAISSIVMVVFITAFNQIQKTAVTLESTMRLDTKAALFQMILENDLSGAFTPSVQPLIFSEDDALEEKVENVFYEEKEGNHISELSFVTCNPLNPSMKFKPRIARIFYYFKDDFDNRGSKIFYRQQNRKEFEYGYAKDSFYKYEVIDGIKSLKFEYVFEKSMEEEEGQEAEDFDKKAKQKLKAEDKEKPDKISTARKRYSVLDELDEQGEAAGKIPSYVIATLELWKDIKNNNWVEFKFKFKIYAANYHMPLLTMPKKKNTKPAPPTPGQAPAQTAGAK